MDPETLRQLLASLARGDRTVESVMARLRHLPFEPVDGATIDHHRALRCGYPEVIFGQGKSPEQVLEVTRRIRAQDQTVLATRVTASQAALVCEQLPAAVHDPVARTLVVAARPPQPLPGRLLVASAGTADQPVAAEAASVAAVLGCAVSRLDDVGVAGLHRLLAHGERLHQADVVIVVAGMEGALPSVVGGMTDVPVIGVPTSVGYGASLAGITALLGMLSSCAAGVTVVNIDNGFGAAYAAARILRRLRTAS
jgi:hypothetical protein